MNDIYVTALREGDYLPAKRLHLFALHVSVDAFDWRQCRCDSTFLRSGRPAPEVDAYAWKAVDGWGDWCGKNMTRVLVALDWQRMERLPEVTTLLLVPA